MKTVTTAVLFAALVFVGGCEKKNVPLGGECTYDEDCDKNGVACLIAPDAETGYCTKPCEISTGGLNANTEPQCPESMRCERADAEHFVLGATFCVR